MHGLINKAMQSFICDSFGAEAWHEVLHRSGLGLLLGADGFEAMQVYDDTLTDAMLDASVTALRRPRDSLLEDLGTYLVSHERMGPLRRLLRFGGVSFTDFLYSLDDLQGRSHLAVPDLAAPDLRLTEDGPDRFRLTCRASRPGFGQVMVGILRAMADDYGALAVLEHQGSDAEGPAAGIFVETIIIEVHDPAFHTAKHFELAAESH